MPYKRERHLCNKCGNWVYAQINSEKMICCKKRMSISNKLILIANKGWSQGLYDRGGLQWLIKAYAEEFNHKDNIELRIKINPAYNNANWDVKDEIEKLGIIKTKTSPKILFCLDSIDDKALCNFYNEGDVFVSTSMADAFNIPVLEAMACGLSVCTTYYGGQSDIVNNKNGWLIKQGSLVNWSKELQYEETKWFKPSIKAIRNKLRYIYNNKKDIDRKRKKVLEEVHNYTWKASAKKIKKLMG